MKRRPMALAGNPNTGKSTLFNAVTGGKQEIGNWPGKTVEKKSGTIRIGKETFELVDLPGTYGLTAYSLEELIARRFLVEERPAAVINVVDASNLERNLYLTVQLMELGANVVVALNMNDVAERRGFRIDVQGLSRLLGVPVVPTVASRGEGVPRLLEEALKAVNEGGEEPLRIDYGPTLEPKIAELEEHIGRHAGKLAGKYGARWLAVKLIERDFEVVDRIKRADTDIYDREFEGFIRNAGEIYGEDSDVEIADRRYGFVNGIVKKTVKRTGASRIEVSDQINSLLTNKYLGIPIFLFVMYATYQAVFSLGEPFVGMLEFLIQASADWLRSAVDGNAPEFATSFLTDGFIGGVGNVLVFIPNIALLFIAIAILEDSGYLARAAFVMDGVMGRIGLHGKSFISLVVGLGCNVPGIMATRTLENEKDRMITILVNSLVPCSARMAVFVFLAGAFFQPAVAAQVVWSLVLAAFLLVMGAGWVFSRFLLPGPRAPFVMELPPYQVPTLKGVLVHSWERTKTFISNAGTFIFLVAVLVWLLASFPAGVDYGSEESYIGQLGKLMSPIFSPLGFGWQGTVALILGFFAKEVIISAFGVLYGGSGGSIAQSMAGAWSPLQAYVFMVFTLIYTPCIAAVAAIRQETRSWKWTAFAVGYALALAWVIAFLVLHAGRLLGY
jgi:ferrous iron transport protein B